MKVIFLNRFFYPDHSATSQLLSDLAFGLAGKGWEVHVVTSWQRYDNPDAKLPAHETVGGVRIHRVRTSRFGRASLWGRALDYLGFYAGAGLRLFRLAGRGDVVVVKTDPPMLSVIAAPVTRLCGAAQINWLQDLFPEVAVALEVRGAEGLTSRLLRRLRDVSLRAAKVNVVLGELMAERVRGFGVGSEKVKVIHNWADGVAIHPVPSDENPLRREWGLDGKFVVGYSGNMGRAHEFWTILDAAEILAGGGSEQGEKQRAASREEGGRKGSGEQRAASSEQGERKGRRSEQRAGSSEQGVASREKQASREQLAGGRKQGERNGSSEQLAESREERKRAARRRQEVVFLFVGDGARRGWIEEEAERRGLGNVLFKPYQPRNILAQSLSVPDVHLISLVPELEGLIVPSKFYGIAAAGRATLFIGDVDGEIPRVLREEECGYAVPLGGGEVLAGRVKELVDNRERCRQMGVRAREVFERKYDKKFALETWEGVIFLKKGGGIRK